MYSTIELTVEMNASTQTEAVDEPVVPHTRSSCLKCSKHFATPSALARHLSQSPRHSSKPKLPTDGRKPTYKPPILEESTCPPTYHTFWNLKAKTRKLPHKLPITKYVAPRFPREMLQCAEQVDFPDLLSREFVAFAQAYDTIVKQKDFVSIDTITQCQIGITNSKQDLLQTGRCRILKDLERKAPKPPSQSLQRLTEDSLRRYMQEARIFILSHAIPWDEFSTWVLPLLGAEISTKVTNVLHGYSAENRHLIRNFSCFIERIILGLLPLQESFYDAELRFLEMHKRHLNGNNPSIEYTKTHIHSHAQELTAKSPHYKQMSDTITDEQRKEMIEMHKTDLLNKIVAHTSYDAKIHELLITSAKYTDISEVPYSELLDNLQHLMRTEAKVNAIRPLPSSSLETKPSASHCLVRRSRSQSSGRSTNRPRTSLARSKSCNSRNRYEHGSIQSGWQLGDALPLMLFPPTYFSMPPPTFFSVPPPNFSMPPPDLMTRPPPNWANTH